MIALSDPAEDEGIFVVKGSHKTIPTSYLRKLHNELIKDKKAAKSGPHKCEMLPQITEPDAGTSERVSLNKGDILAYHGNLSYHMYNRV